MKNNTKILIIVLIELFGLCNLSQSQPIEIDEINRKIQRLNNSNYNRKVEIANLKGQLESLQNKHAEPLRINDSLSLEIERLKQHDKDRQNQLETLLSISGNSSSNIGNKLDTIAILLGIVGLVLSIAAIWLGIYINRKEKKISELLDRSDENLKKQAKSERKVEQTRKLINKDLASLYKKLRREELKDILKRINKAPQQIRIHTSRLLTLDMQEEDFVFLKNLFFKLFTNKELEYLNTNLTVILISHFPSDVAVNQDLLPGIKNYFEKAFFSIDIEKLKVFTSKLLEDYFNDKYPEAPKHLLMTIQALSKNFNPEAVALRMLFDANEDKEKRFKIYKLIREEPTMLILNSTYKQQMINCYSDTTQNSAEENQLIEEMKGNNTSKANGDHAD